VPFIALCEGYLGIDPHFDLWRYFFAANLQKKRERNQSDRLMPMGCASIHLRNNLADKYMALKLPTSNKGWHS
jgi:hypothetical protein